MFGLGRKSKQPLADPELEHQVRDVLSFLFTEHEARINSKQYLPRHLGIKKVIIQADGLLIKLARDVTMPADFLEASIAPSHAPKDWHPVICAALALSEEELPAVPPPYKSFGTLSGLAVLLRPIINQLKEAFSRESYPLTRDRIKLIDNHLSVARMKSIQSAKPR